MIRKVILFIFLLMVTTSIVFFKINKNITPEINALSFEFAHDQKQSLLKSFDLKIAVIGDTHTKEKQKSYELLNTILKEVKKNKPDLVLFVGDYTDHPRKVVNMETHQKKIVKILSQDLNTPTIFVLGNYETWTNYISWYENLRSKNKIVLQNEVILTEINNKNFCIRGLGDYYTKLYDYIDYPKECKNLPKITVTHDPAGAFHPKIAGLVISGHTHCGQIIFPYVGPIWIPSEVPKKAHCGLYKDDKRTVFVTSGIGTTILPIRFGTQSQWDILSVKFK